MAYAIYTFCALLVLVVLIMQWSTWFGRIPSLTGWMGRGTAAPTTPPPVVPGATAPGTTPTPPPPPPLTRWGTIKKSLDDFRLTYWCGTDWFPVVVLIAMINLIIYMMWPTWYGSVWKDNGGKIFILHIVVAVAASTFPTTGKLKQRIAGVVLVFTLLAFLHFFGVPYIGEEPKLDTSETVAESATSQDSGVVTVVEECKTNPYTEPTTGVCGETVELAPVAGEKDQWSQHYKVPLGYRFLTNPDGDVWVRANGGEKKLAKPDNVPDLGTNVRYVEYQSATNKPVKFAFWLGK